MSTKNDVIRPAAPPSQSLWTRHWQKLVAVAVWAAIVGALFWYIRANDLSPAEAVLRALRWMQSSPWAPALYIALYALRPLTLFSATVLTVAGGFLFGPVWGVALTVVAANVSATVAFFVGRYFGAGFLEGNDSAGLVQRYANRLREDSFLTVLIMRFIFLPYDLVSYLSGFLHIHSGPSCSPLSWVRSPAPSRSSCWAPPPRRRRSRTSSSQAICRAWIGGCSPCPWRCSWRASSWRASSSGANGESRGWLLRGQPTKRVDSIKPSWKLRSFQEGGLPAAT